MLKVIIPTCSARMVLDLLRGLVKYETVESRYIVVFNDPTVLLAWPTLAQVEYRSDCLMLFSERVGYVRACNFGYRAADVQDDDYVAVLNDDVVALGDWATPLKEALDAGAAQVGPAMHGVGTKGFWAEDPRNRPTGYDYLEGWCWMARGQTLAEWGTENLYNPTFSPGYCEDMDLSIGLQKWGGKIREIPVPLNHQRSQTFTNREPFWTNNRQYLVQKWGLDRP